MKLSGLVSLCALVGVYAASVAYDEGYDDSSRDMLQVACSDGPKGLARQYPTQGGLPGFPYIGAVPAIGGWGSDKCGSCWALTYQTKTIYVLGIDHGTSFNIALQAMDDLTGGNAKFLGRIEATAEEVAKSKCGL